MFKFKGRRDAPTMLDFWARELKKLSADLEAAENRLNYADPDFLDAAIYELKAIQERRDALLRLVRAATRLQKEG